MACLDGGQCPGKCSRSFSEHMLYDSSRLSPLHVRVFEEETLHSEHDSPKLSKFMQDAGTLICIHFALLHITFSSWLCLGKEANIGSEASIWQGKIQWEKVAISFVSSDFSAYFWLDVALTGIQRPMRLDLRDGI